MTIRFDGRVAIITGAGQGLGRSHALALAARGARVVVNDFGGAIDGSGGSATAAEQVVAEIKAAGGDAIANPADVTRYDQIEEMVRQTVEKWGRIDILVNNAGILRDKSFAKMDLADFRKVVEVHLFGTVNCTKACWEQMRGQDYGRIIVTTSSAGLYGNFGQTAYGAAKLGVVGLMHTLAKEGAKNNIRVNAISPAAATRMTESVLTPQQILDLNPDKVAIGICFLAGENAPSHTILTAGAGSFSLARIVETQGIWVAPNEAALENLTARWQEVVDPAQQTELVNVEDQTIRFLELARVSAPPGE